MLALVCGPSVCFFASSGASQISAHRQPGRFELVGHRSHFALGSLSLEQSGQDGLRCIEGRRTLLSQFRNRRALPCILSSRSILTMEAMEGSCCLAGLN